ncbi:MAG: hypothetical protein ACE5D7_07455, partial [Fidelibacterota bacterium]
MKKFIYFTIFLGIQTILSQAVSDDISVDQILRNEYNTIKVARIEESSFLFPNIIRETNRTHINFLSQKNIRIEPVLGIRWGSAGFEIDPLNTPSPVLWVSPGIKLAGSTYLFDPLLNLWLYAWGRFHKHSAYGFNGSPVLAGQTLFRYHPDYSAEYYSRTIKPDNGIDFDESLGGVALVHPRFHIVWGKFRDHMGPSSRSNLQLSRLMPAFSQLRVVMKPTMQIQFMYLIGQFDSMIPDSNLYHNVYQDNIDETQKIPTLSRYIAMHRIDVLNSNNTFRIGIWEQVIFGARSIPFEYMNPLTLFWSAQHKLGDLDNVQMGIDWELMVKNQRFYGSLLVDEWAPYDTFKGSHEHNWVGSQLGTSRIFGINDHRVMLTAEYTYMDPRTSYHRFP